MKNLTEHINESYARDRAQEIIWICSKRNDFDFEKTVDNIHSDEAHYIDFQTKRMTSSEHGAYYDEMKRILSDKKLFDKLIKKFQKRADKKNA